MDDVVKVRRSFLNDMRGFCNYFAQMCASCYRSTCDCALSDAVARAKVLILRLDNIRDANEELYFIENPHEEIFSRIFRAITQAGRPLKASEIRLDGVYRQRKRWAIKHLVRHGRLEVTVAGNTYLYSVPKNGIKTNKNNKKEN